jgi:hypothetical protein
MPDRPPRLRPSPVWPVLGAVIGGLGGFAFYYFYGCDSG